MGVIDPEMGCMGWKLGLWWIDVGGWKCVVFRWFDWVSYMTIIVRYTHGGQLKKFTFFHFFVSQKGVYLVHKSVIGGHILVHQS
jgi:hypothetical protein